MNIIKNGNKLRPKTLRATSGAWPARLALLSLAALFFTGCASSQMSKVSGNLNNYSLDHVIAILPVETTSRGQKETAELFRRAMYANLTQAKFQLMERYAVDALLKKEGLTDPADYLKVSPIRLGEILGVDAVVLSRVNKVQRLYLVLHASIEVAVSAQMVDTRSGEVLWHAEQSDTSFEGLAKIPTGIIAAGYGPLQFITNKVNLFKATKGIANSITALLKNPLQASAEEKFDRTVIAVAALDDFDDISAGQYAQDPGSQFAAFHKEANPDGPEIQVARLDAIDKAEGKKSSASPLYPELELDHAAYQEKETYANIEETTFTEERQLPELQTSPETGNVKDDLSEQEALLAMANAIDAEDTTAASSARREPEVQLASYQPAEIMPIHSASQTGQESQSSPEPIAQAEDEAMTVAEAPVLKQPARFFSIQIGAFRTQTSAYKMISQFSAKGYSAFINLAQTDGGGSLYKVQLERFQDRDAAIEFAKEFKIQEKMDHFITQVYLADAGTTVTRS